MSINRIKVIAKIFYGHADGFDPALPFDQVVKNMRDESEYRFQIARSKAERMKYDLSFESFRKFMAQ